MRVRIVREALDELARAGDLGECVRRDFDEHAMPRDRDHLGGLERAQADGDGDAAGCFLGDAAGAWAGDVCFALIAACCGYGCAHAIDSTPTVARCLPGEDTHCL